MTLDEGSALPPELANSAITMEVINAMLPHAVAYWHEAGPEFQALDIRIVDLPGMGIAAAGRGTILIDQDAAGFGWFAEQDDPGAGLAGRVDLLSALSHEVGHLLGQRHDADHGVMGEHLALGVRTIPELGHADHGPGLTDLAVDHYFNAALSLGIRDRKSALSSDLGSDLLLTSKNESNESSRRLIAPLVREVVDMKLLGSEPTNSSDAGGGAEDELDLLLGGDAELRMDVESGELTGVLS